MAEAETVDHPPHYQHPSGAGKTKRLWSEMPPKKKPCKECHEEFQPFCGGSMFCPSCRPMRNRRREREATARWRSANPVHSRRVKADWDLRKYFGITLVQYELLLDAQDRKCAICKETSDNKGKGVVRPLVVDHHHLSGKIRGLLCANCNTAIGLLREKTEVFEQAIAYLKQGDSQ